MAVSPEIVYAIVYVCICFFTSNSKQCVIVVFRPRNAFQNSCDILIIIQYIVTTTQHSAKFKDFTVYVGMPLWREMCHQQKHRFVCTHCAHMYSKPVIV